MRPKLDRRELIVGTALALGSAAAAAPASSVESEMRAAAKLLDSEHAAARKAGIPLSEADLQLPAVGDDQDAGPVYRELAEADRKLSAQERDAGSTLLGAALRKEKSAEELKSAAGLLEQWAPFVGLARKVAGRPRLRPSLEWMNAPDAGYPIFSSLRFSARLLCASAVLCESEERSLELLQQAAQVAGHAFDEPVALSALVGIAVWTYVDTAFERLAQRRASDTAQLHRLIELHDNVKRVPDLWYTLRGEALWALDSCRRPREVLDPAKDVDIRSDENKLLDPKLLRLPESLLSAAFEVRLLQLYRRVFQALGRAPAEYWRVLPELKHVTEDEEAQRAPSHRFAQEVAHLYFGVPTAATQLVARQRLRRTYLMLLAERSASGAFPDRLESPPEDPFDQKPVRYRKQDSGFVLYSLGADRKDDSGDRSFVEGLPKDIVLKYP